MRQRRGSTEIRRTIVTTAGATDKVSRSGSGRNLTHIIARSVSTGWRWRKSCWRLRVIRWWSRGWRWKAGSVVGRVIWLITLVQVGSRNVRMLGESGTIRGCCCWRHPWCTRGRGVVGTARCVRRRWWSLRVIGIVVVGGCLFLIALFQMSALMAYNIMSIKAQKATTHVSAHGLCPCDRGPVLDHVPVHDHGHGLARGPYHPSP